MYSFYKYSPIWLQNFFCTAKGYKERKLRFGKGFNEYYDFLLESQWYGESEIEGYQYEKLKCLINYSYKNVPYYKELFKQNKLSTSDIKTIEDLKKIPILTKETVRKRYNDLINPNYKGRIINSHTSGSTGKALHFLFTHDAIKYRWALWFRHRDRFGVTPYDKYATFTGLVAVPINQKKLSKLWGPLL